jgi:transcriptional regulator with XRE-family HTH domain
METIAARIKRLRLERLMTQAQLGAAIDRDQSIVSDMEKGRGFRIDCLPALCRALGVSRGSLYRKRRAATTTAAVPSARRR